MKARVKNWASFQHYKDRAPPWIKLHRSLLDDFDFACLPVASKALAPLLWLLAAESTDGSVCIDTEWLAFRLRMTPRDIDDGLKPLLQNGFLLADSAALASSNQDAIPETETEDIEERRGEKKERAREKKATEFSPNWQPSLEDIACVSKMGFSATQITDLTVACVDHHRSKGNVFKRPSQAFRNFCRNDIKFHGPPRTRESSIGSTRRGNQGIAATVAQVAARMESKPGPDGPGEFRGGGNGSGQAGGIGDFGTHDEASTDGPVIDGTHELVDGDETAGG